MSGLCALGRGAQRDSCALDVDHHADRGHRADLRVDLPVGRSHLPRGRQQRNGRGRVRRPGPLPGPPHLRDRFVQFDRTQRF